MGAICIRISLTSYCWSFTTINSYVSLTAHFIVTSGHCKNEFWMFIPPHSGVHMFDEVCSILKEWGIQNKIMSITLDNASCNDVFTDVIKSEL